MFKKLNLSSATPMHQLVEVLHLDKEFKQNATKEDLVNNHPTFSHVVETYGIRAKVLELTLRGLSVPFKDKRTKEQTLLSAMAMQAHLKKSQGKKARPQDEMVQDIIQRLVSYAQQPVSASDAASTSAAVGLRTRR